MYSWHCDVCGLGPIEVDETAGPVRHLCQAAEGRQAQARPMPGTELKRLLARAGIVSAQGCGCDSRADEMNRRGPAWCRENVDTISGWLREAAHKKGLPYVETLGRLLIRRAIKRAEDNARRHQSPPPKDGGGA